MSDTTLFDNDPRSPAIEPRTLARATDPETSKEAAAEHVASGANDAQCAAVYALVVANPGSTSDELAAAGRTTRHITGRRLPDLEKRGLIRRGTARKSKHTGRKALTWWPAANS